MARVLLIPTSVGGVLAHAGACATVGRELLGRGHEVALAYSGRHTELFAVGLEVIPAAEADPTRFDPTSLAALNRSPEDIMRLIEADRQLIRARAPDVVVVDSRSSGDAACELEDVPRVGINHFLAASPWRMPEPFSSWVSRPGRTRRAVAGARRRLRRDPLDVKTAEAMLNEARRQVGLPPGSGFSNAGDIVACPTTPLLTPARSLPAHWRYVGPITWSAPADTSVPARGTRPLVYVTQGSTGSVQTLRRAVEELRNDEVDLLVTTAGLCDPAELETLAPNVTAARLLPGRACMEAADAAVVHGGDLTTSEAHLAGTPVVVVPHGFDQYIWARRADRLRTGIAVRPPYVPGAIARAVRRVLRDARYAQAAEAVAEHLRPWNGPAAVADLVEHLAGERPDPRTG